jgi:hypothetical protein
MLPLFLLTNLSQKYKVYEITVFYFFHLSQTFPWRYLWEVLFKEFIVEMLPVPISNFLTL